MKHNKTPKKIVEMHFDALTLVKGEYAGKSHSPINPAAEIVGVKSAPIEEYEIGPIAAALELLGVKAEPSNEPTTEPAATESNEPNDAAKASAAGETAADSAADAVDDYVKGAALSAFYSALYSLEYDCGNVLNAPGFDSEARRAALGLLLSNFQEQITELSAVLFAEKATVTETAVKAGARHSAADKRDIQNAHDKIAKARAALDKAHEATSRLLSEKTSSQSEGDEPGDDQGQSAGTKSGVVTPEETEVDEATKAAIIEQTRKSVLDEANAAVKSAVAEAIAPLNEQLTATKSALDESIAKLTEANAKIAELDSARKSAEEQLATIVGASRERQTPGGHSDALEIGNKSGENADTTEIARKAMAENPNMKMADAIGMILNGAKSK